MNKADSTFPEVAFRPHLLTHLARVVVGLGIIFGGYLIAEEMASGTGGLSTFDLWLVFLLIGAGVIGSALWKIYNQRFCLCNTYVSSYQGLLSPRLTTTRLLYEHVRGVEIKQTIFQRMMALGDLHVGSDVNRGEGEIVICGLKNPEALKDLLLERVHVRTSLVDARNAASPT